MVKLSVLVPSVSERRNTFLPKSLDLLYGQWEKLESHNQKRVEILFLVDNKTSYLGDKRTKMVDIAQGEYVCFVDDDDYITDDYLISILNALDNNPNTDAVVFNVEVTINGGPPKLCYYSNKYAADYNTKNSYHRLINHIPCVKRSVSQKVSFPSIKFGEDVGYSKLLKKHIKSEVHINRVLYKYLYNQESTVAQEDLPMVKRKRLKMSPVVLDMVILSNAKTDVLKGITQNTIDTAISGANGLNVNIIVIEQQPDIRYNDAETMYHNAPFNYNQFMNLGARQGKSDWIMFCNSDLIFTNGWLHSLLIANHPVMSPKCPIDVRQTEIKSDTIGNICGKHLSGWAIMMKRDVWAKIGGLDERVSFWCSDNILLWQLKRIGIMPMLVAGSLVRHLGSMTLKTLNSEDQGDLCWGEVTKYNQITGDRLFHDNVNYQNYLRKNG